MDASTPRPRWRRVPRWLAAGLCAGAPLVAGCLATRYSAEYPDMPPLTHSARAPGPRQSSANTSDLQLTDHHQPAHPTPSEQSAHPREIPITLDTVLRLAEEHNARISLAREKLRESEIASEQGASAWLPNTYAGIGYYRHEGGIQDFSGRLLHSSTGAVLPALQIQSEIDLREGVFQQIDLERKIWQQKAELSQVNNEVLLEAAITYVDLLTAKRGDAIATELEKHERKLLDRAERRAEKQVGAAVLVEALRATLSNRQQLSAKLKQQGQAASAKLVYLLGLPPGTCLQPVDAILAPIELVDVTPTACDLVAQSLSNGPGVRELEGMLALVQMAADKANGPHNLLPSIQLNVYEGAFGAGPGATLNWDNRLDVGLQFRWNLTQLCQTEYQRNLIRSKQAQVMYNYEDLRGKLAAGVTESRDAILFGREMIGLAAGQIRHASESYRLSDERLEKGVPDATETDVLMAIRGMEQAHYNYLQSISGHNKAQVRLMMLLGGGLPPPGKEKMKEVPQAAPMLLPAPKLEEKAGPMTMGEWRRSK